RAADRAAGAAGPLRPQGGLAALDPAAHRLPAGDGVPGLPDPGRAQAAVVSAGAERGHGLQRVRGLRAGLRPQARYLVRARMQLDSRQDSQMNASPDDAAEPRGPATSRSIVRATDPQALTTRALEDRRLIHRNDSARVQADAFRDLRSGLQALRGESNCVTLGARVASGCGASSVARDLPAAFAFDETKIENLVDSDALHPAQHTALGLDAADG